MNLYFQHSDGSFSIVRKNCPQDEVYAEMRNYIATLNPNYEIPYVRSWGNDIQGYTYDVGSHTEFFFWGVK